MKFLLTLYKHEMQIESCDESKTYLQYTFIWYLMENFNFIDILHTGNDITR